MAEFDYLSIAVPSLIAGVVSFIIIGVKKLGQTSEGTLSGTIKLEHVSAGMEELEKRMDRRFDKIDNSISKIWDTLDELKSGHKLNTYRLDRLERNNGVKNGG